MFEPDVSHQKWFIKLDCLPSAVLRAKGSLNSGLIRPARSNQALKWLCKSSGGDVEFCRHKQIYSPGMPTGPSLAGLVT